MDEPTREPREFPTMTDPQGDTMVPLCCQDCGAQIGLRSPGPIDTARTASYCYDCAPIDLAEAAMRDRPEAPDGE